MSQIHAAPSADPLQDAIDQLQEQFGKQNPSLYRFLSDEAPDLVKAIEQVVALNTTSDLPDESLFITNEGFDPVPPQHLSDVWDGKGYEDDPEAKK